MPEIIKNRSEILFMYDVTYANPNGDPNDENKPRIDEETGINIVTDVRLKRTIRDYLDNFKNCEIFIKEIRDENNKLKTKELRFEELGKKPEEILSKCIDLRLFGATIAIQNATLTLTGPVQFSYGHSLHRVNLSYIKGTTVMPSGAGKEQGTMTERYILPYSFIVFYGIVNDNSARMQNIPLTDEDVDLMMEAIWYGTKNLISGSKFGHNPRFLMQIVYKDDQNFHIGELDRFVSLKSNLTDESIRDISEFKIEIQKLVDKILENKEKIKEIRLRKDERLNTEPQQFEDLIKREGIVIKPFQF